jgi:hypothetical protein
MHNSSVQWHFSTSEQQRPFDRNMTAITGNVTDNNNGTHGFVRTPDGEFTEFDVPGADPVVGCTCPGFINDLAVVGGYYIDTNSVAHGFVRTPDGNITKFDDPEAGTGAGQGNQHKHRLECASGSSSLYLLEMA